MAGIIETSGLGPRVLGMAAMGKSSREIAEWLKEQGVKVSHVTVGKFLHKNLELRKQATEQVRAAVQHELQKTALSDIQMLDRLRDELYRVVFEDPPLVIEDGVIVRTAEGKTIIDRSTWVKVVRELRETLLLRIKVAGVGDEDRKSKLEELLVQMEAAARAAAE